MNSMKTSLKSIAVLLAAGYPCVAVAEFFGISVPSVFTNEIALGIYTALLVGLIMLVDYSRRPYPRVARCVPPAPRAGGERHRLAA